MSILFENVRLVSGETVFVAIENEKFSYIGKERPEGKFDTVKKCKGELLIPGFYNAHTHIPMTLLRGYGDDLTLRTWLDERILPIEDKMVASDIYDGSMLACAEMISQGIVGFTDMYFFEDKVADAAIASGLKANVSRSVVSFDDSIDYGKDRRVLESFELFRDYNNADDGRIKVEMAIHAEYSNVPSCCRTIRDFCLENRAALTLHLSETKDEHEKCIAKRGVTPTQFFAREGIFDVERTVAAHCVWVSEADMDILAQKGVFVAHNPVSNLKLGSGVMPYSKMKAHNVKIALGTDGAASNNTLSVLKEMQYAALLHKGIERDATVAAAKEMFEAATRVGALAQGREDCGEIKVGYRADCVLIDIDALNNLPAYDIYSALAYSVDRSNILMTVCDGRILYENGEYKSIDIERVRSDFSRSVKRLLNI